MSRAKAMSDSARIICRPRTDITPEEAQAARIAALRFALDCHARKKAALPGGPDDEEEPKNDPTAEPNYRR